MDNSYNNIGLFPQMPVCDKVLHTEASSDYTLPDYKIEIRKLISTKAKVLPPKQYISNNGANLEGELIYKILYVGSDDALYSATLSDKYTFSVPFDFDSHSLNTDDITLNCHCECEAVNTRVHGPRKLNVKSKLLCRVLAFSPSLYTPEVLGGHDSTNIENLIIDTPSLLFKTCESDSITLTDSIAIDPQIDNIRIINTSTSVMISECSASEDKVNVRGEVYLKLLYCNDAQNDEGLVLTRKLPFSTSIFCDGASNVCEACSYGVITEENLRIDENAISIEIALKLWAYAQRNHATAYISDAYSTERVTENTYQWIELIKSIKAFNGNLTQSNSFAITDMKIDPDARILDCDAKLRVLQASVENGKCIIVGECYYQILHCLNGDYASSEAVSSFRYEIDIRSVSVECEVKCLNAIANAVSCRARHDGDRVFIDCEINFCISLLEKYRIELLKEMKLSEKLSKPSGEMTLCYPEKNESLWSVAKQYGERADKIRNQNSISESNDISKKKFLVI